MHTYGRKTVVLTAPKELGIMIEREKFPDIFCYRHSEMMSVWTGYIHLKSLPKVITHKWHCENKNITIVLIIISLYRNGY